MNTYIHEQQFEEHDLKVINKRRYYEIGIADHRSYRIEVKCFGLKHDACITDLGALDTKVFGILSESQVNSLHIIIV